MSPISSLDGLSIHTTAFVLVGIPSHSEQGWLLWSTGCDFRVTDCKVIKRWCGFQLAFRDPYNWKTPAAVSWKLSIWTHQCLSDFGLKSSECRTATNNLEWSFERRPSSPINPSDDCGKNILSATSWDTLPTAKFRAPKTMDKQLLILLSLQVLW